MSYRIVPPVWVVCPNEGLRLRLAIDPVLSGAVTDREQLLTIARFQRFGNSPANGDYVEGIAAVATGTGLLIGVHRRLYVTWIAPALEPALNFSRYFVTILALPATMAFFPHEYPSVITLLETQRFGKPSDLPEDTNSPPLL